MKTKISESLLLPVFYGTLASWILVGGLVAVILCKTIDLDVWISLAGVSGLLLLAVVPAMRRAGWVYSNIRNYHTSEYFYELGNGMDIAKAVGNYEQRVRKSVDAWVKRKLVKASFGALPTGFFFMLIATGSLGKALFLLVLLTVAVAVAVYVAMWVMLLSARKLCYDKYGNIKNG